MISLVSLRVLLLCGLALLLAGVGWRLRAGWIEQGRAEVHALWDADRLYIAEQTSQALLDRDRRGRELLQAFENQRKVKDARIATISRERDAALSSLSNRPNRPNEGDSSVPGSSSTGSSTGCTGATLYRQDGEVLIREAGRADQLRAELEQCQAAYNKAREAIEAVSRKDP